MASVSIASQSTMASEGVESTITLYKIVLLGDSSVGKSNLLLRFIRNTFILDSKPTIGVEFFTKTVQIENNKLVKAQIWDTAGQERYQFIASSYYRKAVGAALVYDTSSRKSFEHVAKWLKVAEENCEPGCTMMLIGNKIDLPSEHRQVTFRDGQEFAERNGMSFVETSALDSTGVSVAFQQLVQEIFWVQSQKEEEERERRRSLGMDGDSLLDPSEEKKQDSNANHSFKLNPYGPKTSDGNRKRGCCGGGGGGGV